MAALFSPVSRIPLTVARVLWELASVGAFAWACGSALKLGGFACTRARLAAVVAAGLFLQPMWQSIFLGQINPLLLALVLADVRMVAAGRRWAGVGVGVAAAIKLTPGIFVVVLLLAGRIRAAAVSAGTFVACGLLGFLVAPKASRVYWSGTFLDTSRVGADYISNQSPFGAAARLLGGPDHVGGWYPVVPLVLGAAGIAVAVAWARRGEWLGAAAVTGTTGLLVSPISWAHHWVWVVPALLFLVRDGRRRWAAGAYLLFCLSPLWWMPRVYGFDGTNTLVANCYLLSGLALVAYMAWSLRRQTGTDEPQHLPDLSRTGGTPSYPSRDRRIGAGRHTGFLHQVTYHHLVQVARTAAGRRADDGPLRLGGVSPCRSWRSGRRTAGSRWCRCRR